MTTTTARADEKILVVDRSLLFENQTIDGFVHCTNLDAYQQLIVSNQKFLWRSTVENDPTHKQIIPYLLFKHQTSYFVMWRRSDASETRLRNKCSLGIGGHIRQEDIDGKSLEQWAEREFNEEVDYTGKLSITPLGIINDDATPVGRVHIGFVYLLEGEHANIQAKSEFKEGKLLTLDQIEQYYDTMETWSQMVFDFLKKMQAQRSNHEPCCR